MKPASFNYVRAESIEHAVQALNVAGGDGKVIAGGQSLMPMMDMSFTENDCNLQVNPTRPRVLRCCHTADLKLKLKL